MVITVDSMDNALIAAAAHVLTHGTPVGPRGRPTLEALGYTFRLTTPRNRRITLPSRKWNEALAVGELCWHWSGSDRVSEIAYYADRWRLFSRDGIHVAGSCYGRKIFRGGDSGFSQWDFVKNELTRDESSRRAVISLFDYSQAASEEPDVACVTNLQFLVREGALNCIATMRSNDLIWGLCYDAYFMTMLQERLAVELGRSLGWYQHTVGSMHVYAEFLGMAESLARSTTRPDLPMVPMVSPDSIPAFLEAERLLRTDPEHGIEEAEALPSYWRDLCQPLVSLAERKSVFGTVRKAR